MAFKNFSFLIISVILLAITEALPADDSKVENAKTKAEANPIPINQEKKSEPVPSSGNATAATGAIVQLESNDSSTANDTKSTTVKPEKPILSFPDNLNLDTGAVRRTFYVVVALTGVVLIYFTVKGIRMKTKRKTRRYGLLSEQELDPLDGDDEEDMTLFEAKRQKKKGRN